MTGPSVNGIRVAGSTQVQIKAYLHAPEVHGSAPVGAVISLEVQRITCALTRVTATLQASSMKGDFEESLTLIAKTGPESSTDSAPELANGIGTGQGTHRSDSASREGRPSPTTKRIFRAIKRLKEADPGLTQDDTAAQLSVELGQDIGVDTVRYVCREMNFKWPRGKGRRF